MEDLSIQIGSVGCGGAVVSGMGRTGFERHLRRDRLRRPFRLVCDRTVSIVRVLTGDSSCGEELGPFESRGGGRSSRFLAAPVRRLREVPAIRAVVAVIRRRSVVVVLRALTYRYRCRTFEPGARRAKRACSDRGAVESS